MQLQEFHFLPTPSGAYRLIIVRNQQACGFLNSINVNPQKAAVMFDAANQVNAEPQSPVTQPYPGSPELEALYNLTREASPNASNYPSDTCVPLEPTDGTEPREAMYGGTFRGEPVLYLSQRSMQNPASDMFFHIMGPNKYENFTWVDGIMLRARGERTDIILVANYNACGFDGRVSFPTAQVKHWLETRPNNRVTFEAGDPHSDDASGATAASKILGEPLIMGCSLQLCAYCPCAALTRRIRLAVSARRRNHDGQHLF